MRMQPQQIHPRKKPTPIEAFHQSCRYWTKSSRHERRTHRRTKQYIGLCILVDWCPASRSFARHARTFTSLRDEVTLVLINPANARTGSSGATGSHGRPSAPRRWLPCSNSFRSMPRNLFWWMRKEPIMTGRTGRIDYFEFWVESVTTILECSFFQLTHHLIPKTGTTMNEEKVLTEEIAGQFLKDPEGMDLDPFTKLENEMLWI